VCASHKRSKMQISWLLAGALLVSQADAWAPMGGLSALRTGSRLPLRAASAPSRSGRVAGPVMMAKAKSASEALRLMEEKQKSQVWCHASRVARGGMSTRSLLFAAIFQRCFLVALGQSSGILTEVPDGNHVQARTTFDTTFDSYVVKVLPGPANPCNISSPVRVLCP